MPCQHVGEHGAHRGVIVDDKYGHGGVTYRSLATAMPKRGSA
jgi:hypothetical protein